MTQRLIHASLVRAALAALVLSAGCSGSKSPGSGDNDGGGSDLEGDAEAVTTDEDGGTDDPALSDASTGPAACTPRTCADAKANCGPIADGCGGLVQCGTCTEPGAICGGGGTPSVCGGGLGSCKPRTCADVGANCGPIGDGCGKLIECGTCTTPGQSCGAGGVHSQCGGPIENPQTCAGQVTCADVGAECGDIGNGCGGIIHCGNPCTGNAVCGGGGVHNKCGAPTCTPGTCAGVEANHCGPVSDGCGGLLTDCGTTCTLPDTCGGGGVRDRCGNGTTACQPLGRDAACAGARCGPVSDGCGGQLDCGGCPSGQSCGGGSAPGVCGAPACVPATCAQLNLNCGTAPDGCGNTLQCNSCPSGQTCGGGGAPGQCGAPSCTPKSCAEQAITCGPAGNGCGGRIDSCGPACPSGQTCGGGNVLGQCGAPPACVPTATSCAALGWACGTAIDNCGNTYDCRAEGRACSGLEACVGGIGGPTRCVGGVPQGSCPLCSAVPACTGAPQTTQLTGRVVTPGRNDQNSANQVGVPNAFVYILRANDASLLPAISAGIPAGGTSCDRCADQDLGPVLTSALTDAQGNYVLRGNIPVGTPFQLVVKVGKFRRAVTYTVAPSGACNTSAVPALTTRLPRTRTDGAGANLPKIAVSTGEIDAMECVFEKLGIDHTEFANPGANGGNAQRIHLYRGGIDANTPKGASIDANTPFDGTLYGNLTRMLGYDMIVADCEGQSWDGGGGRNFTQRDASGANVREFVNRGGRMFASHLSMSWLHGNGTQAYAAATFAGTGLGPAATWDINALDSGNLNTDGTGVISIVGNRPRASSRIVNFTAWMARENVATGPGYSFPITDPRSLATDLGATTEEFVYRSDGNLRVQQFSFNSPYGAPTAASCGRVAHSGFHVAATGGGNTPFQNVTFPNHCSGDLTGQEKVLLYMLFDLGACVGNEPVPPSCTPTTCQAQGAQCGVIGNGCGGTLRCNDCAAGQQCVNHQCLTTCQPRTCQQAQANCGPVSDGCGGTLECGTCPNGQTCGAGGTPNQCSVTQCQPRSCASVAAGCGLLADGCGQVINCGDCAPGKICGANGHPNQCGVGECPPRTCASEQAQCGFIGDGCGGAVNCGPCLDGQSCGAGGVPNHCGGQCTPLTCQAVNAQCGFIGTGCGGSIDCGTCRPGQTCGAAGPNRCGGSCDPLTCEGVGAECGFIGDGCGNAVNCGPCPPGKTCGGGGIPNKCGDGPGCKPESCASVGANCGLIGDGCGSTVNCGPCPDGQTCGGGGTPNQCGGTCKKQTCEDHHANCGQVSDGCGGVLECGVCAPPYTCGTGDSPNQCAGVILQ